MLGFTRSTQPTMLLMLNHHSLLIIQSSYLSFIKLNHILNFKLFLSIRQWQDAAATITCIVMAPTF
jgi:hypothetical protein